jgi:hypothetical protein
MSGFELAPVKTLAPFLNTFLIMKLTYIFIIFLGVTLIGPSSYAIDSKSCRGQAITKVEQILAVGVKHPCYEWVVKVIPRIVQLENGSGVVLSHNQKGHMGLLATARHVSHSHVASQESSYAGFLGDLTRTDKFPDYHTAQTKLYQLQNDQKSLLQRQIALWRFLTPSISPLYMDDPNLVMPVKVDYDLYVFTDDELGLSAKPISSLFDADIDWLKVPQQDTPLYDWKTEGQVTVGSTVLIVGHPMFSASGSVLELKAEYDKGDKPGLAITTGEVMSDAEAAHFTEKGFLKMHLPELKYDPDSDVYIRAQIAHGFSGGGIFDSEGRLIGVLSVSTGISISAGSEALEYGTGAVRLSYLKTILEKNIQSLPKDQYQTFLNLIR